MRKLKLSQRSKMIGGVTDFLIDLSDARKEQQPGLDTWYFRGDKCGAPLCPSIGRPLEYAGKTLLASEDIERKLLNRFKRYAYAHMNRTLTDWEAMFLARHFELPTRILDWTSNPLAALYFACSPGEKAATDGVVWAIVRIANDNDDVDIFQSTDPFRLFESDEDAGKPTIKLIYPVYNSSRITAQKGIFSWHSHPHVALDRWAGTDFDDDKLDIEVLVRWSVPAARQTQIIQELENLGVNQRSIFPDLTGIAKAIWQTEVLWKGA